MLAEEIWRVQTQVTPPIPHYALHSCSQCSCLYHNQPQLGLCPLTFNLSTHLFHSTAVCSCVRWLRGRVAWDHLSSRPFPPQLLVLFLSQQQQLISTPNCLSVTAWWSFTKVCLVCCNSFTWNDFRGTSFPRVATLFCFICSSTFGFDWVWFLCSYVFRNFLNKCLLEIVVCI